MIVSRDVFSLRSEDTSAVWKGQTQAVLTMRNACPKVHPAHLPLWWARFSTLQPSAHMHSFSWKKNLDEQGNRVLPCLLAWTTWARDTGDIPCPYRPEMSWTGSLANLCNGHPESLFLQHLRALCPAALLFCGYSEASLTVITSCLNYYYSN